MTTAGTDRKLRPLVISMGGDREQHIRAMFRQPEMARHFEEPVFSPGVPSRSIRSRKDLLQTAHKAGLLPEMEWQAIERAYRESTVHQEHPELFFEACLDGIPITPEGRHGSARDKSVHYSVELRQKAKTLNRGRSVLGCFLAHLMAMKTCVEEGFDVILEDNVRVATEVCADRIRGAIAASEQRCRETGVQCHMRYYGWLGSKPNLEWVLTKHIVSKGFPKTASAVSDSTDRHSGDNLSPAVVFPYPTLEDFAEGTEMSNDTSSSMGGGVRASDGAGDGTSEKATTKSNPDAREAAPDDCANDTDDGDDDDSIGKGVGHNKPGGTAIWGAYAYWVSRAGYDTLLSKLRRDVGAMLWKGKRMRQYVAKPIDKVLPRTIAAAIGRDCIHVTGQPVFFRAPMLTSKIHSQWDPEFCKSTEYQLCQTGLRWSDVWLTETERDVVAHCQETGEWITPAALSGLRGDTSALEREKQRGWDS